MNNKKYIEMKNISKRFIGVQALSNVDFSVRKGEIHALVGENGAGKSTLMKILIGMYRPDEGEIYINGEKKIFGSMRDALGSGISMIFQEYNSVDQLTVAENIYLGRQPVTEYRTVNYRKMFLDAREIFKKMDVDIDPREKVSGLTTAKRQLVEIAKAISHDSDIIIMDEPTSALSLSEINNLFRIVRELVANGKTIIFISHKLDEIYEICESVTVLRDGKLIGSGATKNISVNELIKMMVDRELTEMFPKEAAEIGETIFEAKGLTRNGEFYDISFEVKKGEILGIAGLMGAGRTELVESIYGIRKLDRGEIYIKGRKVNIRQPKNAIANGISMIPEDRAVRGLAAKLSVKDNILITNIDKCINHFYISRKKEKENINHYAKILEIKMKDENQMVSELSGGNQQKVVVARALFPEPDIIILDEPTRGIDVKTKSDIHRLMSRLAQRGKAIIMISSEIPEILGVSDRIIVLHEGRLTGEIRRSEATQERILSYAMGQN